MSQAWSLPPWSFWSNRRQVTKQAGRLVHDVPQALTKLNKGRCGAEQGGRDGWSRKPLQGEDIEKTAEGREGSSHGNIWGKSGPDKGTAGAKTLRQEQLDVACSWITGEVAGGGVRGRVEGASGEVEDQSNQPGHVTWAGYQDTEVDFTVWWEGVEDFEQKNDGTSLMGFTYGGWCAEERD